MQEQQSRLVKTINKIIYSDMRNMKNFTSYNQNKHKTINNILAIQRSNDLFINKISKNLKTSTSKIYKKKT